jgi:hypothetical protein
LMPQNLPPRPVRLSDENGPDTFGYLRREGKWMHLLCNVCGHEREVDTAAMAPFAGMPDSTVVPTLGKSMVCSKCGTKGKIWSVPELYGASPETLQRWRSS